MERESRFKLLTDDARHDVCADDVAAAMSGEAGGAGLAGRYRQLGDRFTPAKCSAPLLRILLTNYCEKNCGYCVNRRSANVRRASFTPDEMARFFHMIHTRGLVRGLFLSSGIHGNLVRTQDKLLAVAELLRRRYRYSGYLHLKILPGAQPAQIEQAVALASRVSINIEAPSRRVLEKIAPDKDMDEELLRPIKIIDALQRRGRRARLGYTTQLVVGAGGESDAEIMRATTYLYHRLGLRRAYYSGFQPVPDTPLDGIAPASALRQHRLYQADALVREYGFDVASLPFSVDGNLSLEKDPKVMWADAHPELFPVELNRAWYEQLIRVPGIGPRFARRIISLRRLDSIRDPDQLARNGIHIPRALPYVLFDGRRCAHRQLDFFNRHRHVVVGEGEQV
ncbi:radical SAM protein [bacterium]|nr:radical SAM protein [candidate division CSSED10-310 bacterium]